MNQRSANFLFLTKIVLLHGKNPVNAAVLPLHYFGPNIFFTQKTMHIFSDILC